MLLPLCNVGRTASRGRTSCIAWSKSCSDAWGGSGNGYWQVTRQLREQEYRIWRHWSPTRQSFFGMQNEPTVTAITARAIYAGDDSLVLSVFTWASTETHGPWFVDFCITNLQTCFTGHTYVLYMYYILLHIIYVYILICTLCTLKHIPHICIIMRNVYKRMAQSEREREWDGDLANRKKEENRDVKRSGKVRWIRSNKFKDRSDKQDRVIICIYIYVFNSTIYYWCRYILILWFDT